MKFSAPAAALEALKCSMAAKLPHRVVQRSLVEPANAKQEELQSGLICLVTESGGNWANYHGREGQLGSLNVRVVAFILVDEKSEPSAVEDAEFDLLSDVLAWTQDPAAMADLDIVYPGEFHLSKQLEHPMGWMTIALDVRF